MIQTLKIDKKPFSIIIDETTDRGDNKQVALLIKYYEDKLQRVETKFYWMETLNFATGENLFKVLNTCLTADELSWDNFVGLGSDSAAALVGTKKGMMGFVQTMQKQAYDTKCVCHIAHTCASDACKKLPGYLEDVLQEIYWHFNRSSKRVAQYQEFQYFCET